MIGNILDYVSEDNIRDIGMKNNRRSAVDIKQDIVKLFMTQKLNNLDAISFLVKKMIHNNLPEVTSIVKEKSIIESLLQCSIENLDTVVACYKFKNLQKHVLDVVCCMKDEKLFQFISNMKPISSHKTMNKNLLSVILILIQTLNGTEKAFKAISKDLEIFNNFIFIIFYGIQSENVFGEIMFHLELICELLDTNDFFSCALVSGDHLTKISEKLPKATPENFVKKNTKLVQYGIDLIMLQIVALFLNVNLLRFNSESELFSLLFIFFLLKYTLFQTNTI